MPLRFWKNPWRLIGYFVIAVVVIALCSLVLYVVNERRLKHKYEAALARLQVGDSEQTVVALMGEPDERDWCYPLPTNGDSAEQKRFHEECVVEYTYVTFLENYGVSLDKNNRVSGKWKSVSP
jgi:hypothetical protein